MKTTRRMIFRFGFLFMNIFFYATRKFLDISDWDTDECTMQLVTCTYRAKLEMVRDHDID